MVSNEHCSQLLLLLLPSLLPLLLAAAVTRGYFA